MAQFIVACAFIDQQFPLRGQICFVEVLDTITSTSKYRVRYLPAPQFGNSVEEDCREAAKRGSKLQQQTAEPLLLLHGERPEPPIPV